MKHAVFALLLLLLLPSCTPVRSTAKVGVKTVWAVGKAGTTVATVPLRVAGRRNASSDDGGGSYRVKGRTYHVMSSAQARRYKRTGMASYYRGGKTATGERTTSRSMTAAHKTLPFGTRVRVTNLANRKSITVRINDRGPFVDGRIIDLTKRGADKLGFRKQGVAKVQVDVL